MKRYKISKDKYSSRIYKKWLASLEEWSFDSKDLFDLVRTKKKKATSYIFDGDNFNEYSILRNGRKKLLLKTVNIEIKKFKDVEEAFAKKEGEGDHSLKYWKKVHKEFFTKELNGDFDENINIVCEEFIVVCKL